MQLKKMILLFPLPLLTFLISYVSAYRRDGHFHAIPFKYGARSWKDRKNTECGGNIQSPIDIQTDSAKTPTSPDQFGTSDFFANVIVQKPYQVTTNNVTDKGTTHALVLTFKPDASPEDKEIHCAQYHFHIGKSEHTVNGQDYLAEQHIVCYRMKFNDITEAVASKEADALLVFGSFIMEKPDAPANPYMAKVIDAYNKSGNTNKTDDQNTFLIPVALDTTAYYRYAGSLTTPECNEVVLWTVFRDPIYVSSAQAATLKDMNELVTDNTRPTQPLNGREVYIYEESTSESQSGGQTCMMFVILGFVIFFVVAAGISATLKKRSHTPGQEVDDEEASKAEEDK